MTFFKGLMRALAAAGAIALFEVVEAVRNYVQTTTPSDIPAGAWMLLSAVLVLGLNFILAKYKKEDPTP